MLLVLFDFIHLNFIGLFIILKSSILSEKIASYYMSQDIILHIQLRNFHGVSSYKIFMLQDPLLF